MTRLLARGAVMLAMFLVAVVLCLDIAYFIRGSLEEFPSEEDHDKIRIVTGVIALPLLGIEILLWRLLRMTSREVSTSGGAFP